MQWRRGGRKRRRDYDRGRILGLVDHKGSSAKVALLKTSASTRSDEGVTKYLCACRISFSEKCTDSIFVQKVRRHAYRMFFPAHERREDFIFEKVRRQDLIFAKNLLSRFFSREKCADEMFFLCKVRR